MVQKLHPAVVLLDLSMPVMNGLEAARQIAEIAPGTHVLMFTLHPYPHLIREARSVGVKGVISKSDQGSPKVLDAIRSSYDINFQNLFRLQRFSWCLRSDCG
jgi:DNA-binding NarL/FixJ family response regulator